MKSRHLAILVVVSFLAVVSATLVVTSLVLSPAVVDDERLALLEHEPIHRGQRGNSVLDAGERDEGLPAHPALQEPELEIVSVLAQLLGGLLKAEKDANQVLLGGRLGQVLDVQGL